MNVGCGVGEGVADVAGEAAVVAPDGVEVSTLVGDGGGATVAAGADEASAGADVARGVIAVGETTGVLIASPVVGVPAHEARKRSNRRPAANRKRPNTDCNRIELQASALPSHGHSRGGQLLHFADERVGFRGPDRGQLPIFQTGAIYLHV